MSGLARVLKAMGKKVSGSDCMESTMSKKLRAEGIEVIIGHRAENLPSNTEIVVYSQAIVPDNPELAEAKKRDLIIWSRSQLIGALMENKIAIAVAGTRGKSTVAAMIATILEESGEDPTILVGATVKAIDSNAKYGYSDLMVAEACEYKKSFLDFKPTIAVITNIEEEHLDDYKNLSDIKDNFALFGAKVPAEGLIVACLDDPDVADVVQKQVANVVGYGWQQPPVWFEGVFWRLSDYKVTGNKINFRASSEDIVYDITLSIPGKFNALNAVAALAVADFLVMDIPEVIKILENFTGAGRRFEIMGKFRGVELIEDYGHHPTAIRNLINGVREFYPKKKLWMVFQPHQYSRTLDLLDDFAVCFAGVDQLLLADIYEARDSEEAKVKINSQKLAKIVAKNKVKTEYLGTRSKIKDFVKKNLPKDALLLIVGAGDINLLTGELLLNKKC